MLKINISKNTFQKINFIFGLTIFIGFIISVIVFFRNENIFNFTNNLITLLIVWEIIIFLVIYNVWHQWATVVLKNFTLLKNKKLIHKTIFYKQNKFCYHFIIEFFWICFVLLFVTVSWGLVFIIYDKANIYLENISNFLVLFFYLIYAWGFFYLFINYFSKKAKIERSSIFVTLFHYNKQRVFPCRKIVSFFLKLFAFIILPFLNLFLFKSSKKNTKSNLMLIVDCQNDFAEYGTLPVKNATNVFLKISQFMKQYEIYFDFVFSQDWHPINHVSFTTWPKHCIKFTYGAKISQVFDHVKNKKIIKKGTKTKIDNYSMFYNGNKKTKLLNHIKKNNYKTIFVVGVAGEYCVKATAIDCAKFNLNVKLIDELIAFTDDHNKNYLQDHFINIKDVTKYL